MDYCEAPTTVDGPQPRVFLGGGIMGCEDWQSAARQELAEEKDMTLVNPRQAEWYPGDNPGIRKAQVAWEYKSLRKCNVCSMWFSNATLQPICMFELGVLLERFRVRDMSLRVLVLGVHPDYEREFDVNTQVDLVMRGVGSITRKRFLQSDCFVDHVANIKTAIKMSRKMSGGSIVGEAGK